MRKYCKLPRQPSSTTSRAFAVAFDMLLSAILHPITVLEFEILFDRRADLSQRCRSLDRKGTG